MHICIHSFTGNPTPASLQCHWISKACSVISVLIQPVPAVSHKIGVKADHHLPIGRLLLSDPIKYCVESTFTAPWVQTQAHYRKQIGVVSACYFKYVNMCTYPLDGAVTMYHKGVVWLSCPSSPSQSRTHGADSWAAL